MDIREYIINNFKEDDVDALKESIMSSISSNDEEPLIGLGVIFELCWNNSNDEEKNMILNAIKKGLV